jgi:hypothetical protein
MEKLKLYQQAFPDSKKSFFCDKLNLFIEEASCFRRIFVDKSKRQCRECRVHENKMDRFNEFLDDPNKFLNAEKPVQQVAG